jgi:hypothetical protein
MIGLGTNDCERKVQWGTRRNRSVDSHLANAFVDIGVAGEGGYLARGQLKHTDFALLAAYL